VKKKIFTVDTFYTFYTYFYCKCLNIVYVFRYFLKYMNINKYIWGKKGLRSFINVNVQQNENGKKM
jgi:hypothetical protein